jgi:hypothetical protein
MKSPNLIYFICKLFLLLALQTNKPAVAQDDIDIRGGFFEKNIMQEGVFGEEKPKHRGRNKSEVDSWTVDEAEFRKQKDAWEREISSSVEKKAPELERQMKEVEHVMPKPESGTNHESVLDHANEVMRKLRQIQGAPPQAENIDERSKFIKQIVSGDASNEQIMEGKIDGIEYLPTGTFPDNFNNNTNATLSLVISASPLEHFQRHIDRLASVSKSRNVDIGEILIVGVDASFPLYSSGVNESLKRAGLKPSVVYTQLEKINMTSIKAVQNTESVLEHLQVEASPSWVITHQGRHYVFQGAFHPSEFFDARGNFRREDLVTESVPLQLPVSLLNKTIPVVTPKSGSGTIKFPKPSSIEIKPMIIPDELKDKVSLPEDFYKSPVALNALLITRNPETRVEGDKGESITNYPLASFPSCVENTVIRKKSFHYTPLTEHLDVLYYQSGDTRQETRAGTYMGNKVRYNPKQAFDILNTNKNPFPLFASIFRIRCLPTRFRYVVSEDGNRFMEYREGLKAWDNVGIRNIK